MKNRLRSARPQGSATASRRAVRVLDGVFASAPVSVIKGADAPFFLQKGVTHVREHLLPMSEVHRDSGGRGIRPKWTLCAKPPGGEGTLERIRA